MRIFDVKSWPASSGKTHMLRYLEGEKLTQRQAIMANCARCLCGYVDGRFSCEDPDCPFFPWMPYRKHIRPEKMLGDNEEG